MVVPPPGRFSITMLDFQSLLTISASVRVKRSVPPPGANGTRIRTGRDGKPSAATAGPLAAASQATTHARSNRPMNRMGFLSFFLLVGPRGSCRKSVRPAKAVARRRYPWALRKSQGPASARGAFGKGGPEDRE